MNVDIQVYSGKSLAAEITVLTKFRLRYFREFPYLYVATEESEREHTAEYSANPTTRLFLARDTDCGRKIVGVAISIHVRPRFFLPIFRYNDHHDVAANRSPVR